MKLDPAVHRLSKNNGAFQPIDFKVDLGPSIYGTVQQAPPSPVMVMVRRIMCMEGLSHRDMLPPPPPVGVGGGCGGSMFVFYV